MHSRCGTADLHIRALVPKIEMVLMSLQIGTFFEVFVVEIQIEMVCLDEVQKMHSVIESRKLTVGLINIRADVLHTLDALVADPRHSLSNSLFVIVCGKTMPRRSHSSRLSPM